MVVLNQEQLIKEMMVLIQYFQLSHLLVEVEEVAVIQALEQVELVVLAAVALEEHHHQEQLVVQEIHHP